MIVKIFPNDKNYRKKYCQEVKNGLQPTWTRREISNIFERQLVRRGIE